MPVSPHSRSVTSELSGSLSPIRGEGTSLASAPDGALDVAVRCREVCKAYRGAFARRGRSVVAVDGVDLEIARGESFGLLGPNGAGKTTLVEILEGVVPPSSGSVEVLGRSWSHEAGELRRRIGVCLQETRLPDHASVQECLELFASLYPRPRSVGELLRDVALAGREDALVSKLSGGQRQRLAIACALVGAPEMLFLDEPTTGLDPQSRRQVWDLVRSFVAGGGTLLLTTHYMEEAEQLCDRVAVIDRGRIVRVGRPAELIAGLGGEHIVELQMDGAGVEMDRLAELPGVARVGRAHGDAARWSLTAPEPHVTLPALLDLVERSEVKLAHLSTRRTTLEDVFVSLTGRSLHDA